MRSNKLAKSLSISFIAVFALTSVAFAVNVKNDKSDKIVEKEVHTPQSKEKGPKHKEIVAASFEEYQDAVNIEIEGKRNNKLSQDQRVELYNKGYDFFDIDKAESLSLFCNMTTEEILQYKGPTNFITKTLDENGVKSTVIEDTSKKWEDVIRELDIDTREFEKRLDITSDEVAKLRSRGFSDREIAEVSALVFNYRKDPNEVLDELDKGKSLKDIKKGYWEEDIKAREKQAKLMDHNKGKIEETIRKQFNITDEEIEKSKKNGVVEIFDIGYAKDLAKKHNTTLDKVLEVKKKKKNWSEVPDELGGTK